MTCPQALEKIDSWLDGALPAADSAAFDLHIAQCAACAQTAGSRRTLRNRLRTLARNVSAPENLRAGIRGRLDREQSAQNTRRGFLAAAAAVVLTAGTYSVWKVRSARHGAGAGFAVMRVGADQHVHCAVARVYPAALEVHPDLDPELAPYVSSVTRNLPAGYTVEMSHRCSSARGRQFAHVIARAGDGSLISLLVTRKQPDEQATPAPGADSATAGGWAVAVSASDRNLVYLVSRLDERDNRAALERIMPEIPASG